MSETDLPGRGHFVIRGATALTMDPQHGEVVDCDIEVRAGRIVDVRLKYGMTVDKAEAEALELVLAGCESTALEPVVCAAPSGSSGAAGGVAGDDALARYDDNRNGAITCAEARRHGIAPVPRSHPAYRYMRDGDGDGVVCE